MIIIKCFYIKHFNSKGQRCLLTCVPLGHKTYGSNGQKCPLINVPKWTSPNGQRDEKGDIWQKKQVQYLFVINVVMNQVNGLENVRHVMNGTHLLKRKFLQILLEMAKI